MSPIMAASGTCIVDVMDAAALCCATGPKCVPGGKQGGDGLHSCKPLHHNCLQLLESLQTQTQHGIQQLDEKKFVCFVLKHKTVTNISCAY